MSLVLEIDPRLEGADGAFSTCEATQVSSLHFAFSAAAGVAAESELL